MAQQLSPSKLWLAFSILALACLAGCSASSTSSKSIDGTSREAGEGAKASAPTWETLDLGGTITSGRFKGRNVLRLDKAKKEITLTLPLIANPYLDGLSFTTPLTKVTNSALALSPAASSGSEVTLRISLMSLVKATVNGTTAMTLPNGQALPGIADASVVSETVNLNARAPTKATIYLGKNVVGVYVNTTINPLASITAPIMNVDGTREWGQFVSIPASIVNGQNKDGGYFITTHLPIDISQAIEAAL